MLEKKSSVDKIEVVDNGIVQVRTKIVVLENGQEIGGSLHRHTVAPGDDYSGEDARVQAICAAAHTPEVMEAYKTATAAKGV